MVMRSAIDSIQAKPAEPNVTLGAPGVEDSREVWTLFLEGPRPSRKKSSHQTRENDDQPEHERDRADPQCLDLPQLQLSSRQLCPMSPRPPEVTVRFR